MGKYLSSIQSEGISNLYQSHTLPALAPTVNASIDF